MTTPVARSWLRWRAVVPAAAMVLTSACLELPEAGPSADIDAVDEESLRELTRFVDLEVCTEEGWAGSLQNDATTALKAEIVVVFKGFGTDTLGEGAQSISVDAESRESFEVVPEPPIDQLVLSCNIEIATLELMTE